MTALSSGFPTNDRLSGAIDSPVPDGLRGDDEVVFPVSSLLGLLEKLSGAATIFWTTDLNLRITSLRGVGLSLMKLRADDYIGGRATDFLINLAPYDSSRAHKRALAGGTCTFDMGAKGRHLNCHVEPLRGTSGAIIGVIGVILDYTATRVAEKALRLSEHSYRSFFEEAPYAICRATVSGQPLQINRRMVEMLGYESESEVLLRNLRTEIFIDMNSFDELKARFIAAAPCLCFECAWRRRNDETLQVRLGGRVACNVDGEIFYLEILCEDVTERKHQTST